MDKQTEKEKSPLLALLANLQRRQLTPQEQQQIRQALGRYFEGDILFYQPKLWPRLQQADWATWLQELIKFLETYDLLAEEILLLDLEGATPDQALVPDKITLQELLADLKEAEQQRVEIDRWLARMMQQAGLDRPTVEEVVRLALREVGQEKTAALTSKPTSAHPSQKEATVPPVASLLQALDLVAPANFAPPAPSQPHLAPPNPLVQELAAHLQLQLAAQELSAGKAAARPQVTEQLVTSPPPVWPKRVIAASPRLRQQLASPRPRPGAKETERLTQAQNFLNQWQQLPPAAQEQSLIAFHRQFWQGALGQTLPSATGAPKGGLAQILTLVHLPLASPRWQQAARETTVNWHHWSLAKPWREFFASRQLPAQISLAQAGQTIVSGLKENPALLRATLAASPDQSGLGHFYRALSFFRLPRFNQSLGKITPQAVPPLAQPFVGWQQKTARHQTWAYRFYWRLAGGHNRWWQPSWEKGGGYLRSAFSGLGRRLENWLLRRGLGWAEKQLAKTGLKVALKEGLVKLATLLGLGSGPPGWVVTVLVWAKGILGKVGSWLGRLVFGRGGLGHFLASFGGLIELPAGESPSFKKMALVVGGSLLVVILLLPLLVIITIAGAIFTSSERGQASAAYFNLLYKDRVACQAEARSPIARQACLIENAFQKCQGSSEVPVVTEENFGQMVPCLQENGVDAAAIATLRQGIVDHTLQCVGFAKAAVPWLRTVRVAAARDFLNYFGQKSWQDLQPGDVVVSDAGEYGHVAVVTAVLDPGIGETMVQISQADGYQGTVFTSRLPLNYFIQSDHWHLLQQP